MGLVMNTDLQLNKLHRFQFKAMLNQGELIQTVDFHSFDFIRGRIVSLDETSGAFESMSLEKQFISKQIDDESGSLVLAGEHTLGDWFLEESIGYSFARTDSRDGVNGVFRTEREIDGQYSLLPDPERPAIEVSRNGQVLDAADLQDPAPYQFIRYDLTDDFADDAELALRANLSRSWGSKEEKWTLKTGIKARLRDAENGQDRIKYFPVTGAGFSLAEVAGSGEATVFRQTYPLGPAWSSEAMDLRFTENPIDFQADPQVTLIDSLASDFKVSESIYATFAMVQMESDKWVMVTGFRLERTDSKTSGYETITMKDESGERIVEVNPVSLEDTYDMLFPGFHLLYRINPDWVVRGSLTRTLQRPDFRDLSPSMRVDLDTKRIRAGNPELDPFDAKAVDIGTDFVINEWSSASLGVFYKRIDDFIVDVETEVEYLGENGFTLAQPVNGSPADLLGLEAALSTKIPHLPYPFEDTDLSVNYTLTDSSAAYPGYPGETIMLPKQVRQTLNLDLRWRYNNWSVSWRARYRGEQLNDLIEPGQDQINRGFWSYSLGCNYKLNDTLSFSIGVANLNRPDRVSYQGVPLHTVSNNAGSRSYSIGLNMKL
jgi:TonB-dependent receptor